MFPKSICDDISEENVEKIFANFDTTGDKSVDFEEFKVSSSSSRMTIIIDLNRRSCPKLQVTDGKNVQVIINITPP